MAIMETLLFLMYFGSYITFNIHFASVISYSGVFAVNTPSQSVGGEEQKDNGRSKEGCSVGTQRRSSGGWGEALLASACNGAKQRKAGIY